MARVGFGDVKVSSLGFQDHYVMFHKRVKALLGSLVMNFYLLWLY